MATMTLDYETGATINLDELATRAQRAIDEKGPLPIPNYAGIHHYNDFEVRGDSLYGQKSRKWFAITTNDARWLHTMLERHGY